MRDSLGLIISDREIMVFGPQLAVYRNTVITSCRRGNLNPRATNGKEIVTPPSAVHNDGSFFRQIVIGFALKMNELCF